MLLLRTAPVEMQSSMTYMAETTCAYQAQIVFWVRSTMLVSGFEDRPSLEGGTYWTTSLEIELRKWLFKEAEEQSPSLGVWGLRRQLYPWQSCTVKTAPAQIAFKIQWLPKTELRDCENLCARASNVGQWSWQTLTRLAVQSSHAGVRIGIRNTVGREIFNQRRGSQVV